MWAVRVRWIFPLLTSRLFSLIMHLVSKLSGLLTFRWRWAAKGKGTMGELTRGERLQIMLMQEELRALDDWRFKRRMPSRAAAVRELLKRGLAAEGIEVAGDGAKSQDFGVLADSENVDQAVAGNQ